MKIILKLLYMQIFNLMWRRNNRHNETTAVSRFNRESVKVGRGTYGPLRVNQYNKGAKLVIGSYCSIADNVTFLLGGEHSYKTISSFPFNSKVYHLPNLKASEIWGGGGHDITIGDDVWIGFGVTILAGVTIGTGTIIGAGSIVAKDIPPYSVFVGNKVIKQRFTEDIVKKLMKIDWNKVSHNKGDNYEEYVNTKLNGDNINEVLEAFLHKE